MMERNGILLAAKRVLFTIVIGLLCSLSLSADYELTITNNDGTETKECIKSYSFSNNLESIAKQNGVGQDIYSKEETLTNKVYLGKPVYRIMVEKNIVNSSWNEYKLADDVTVINSKVRWEFNRGAHYESQAYPEHVDSVNNKSSVEYIARKGTQNIKSVLMTIEYTKDTDSIIDTSNKFKSYFHYILSSSQTDELTSLDLKDIGVRFKEGYAYDSSTNSCTKK